MGCVSIMKKIEVCLSLDEVNIVFLKSLVLFGWSQGCFIEYVFRLYFIETRSWKNIFS